MFVFRNIISNAVCVGGAHVPSCACGGQETMWWVQGLNSGLQACVVTWFLSDWHSDCAEMASHSSFTLRFSDA